MLGTENTGAQVAGTAPDGGALHLLTAELTRRLEAAPLMQRAPAQCTHEEQARLGVLLHDLTVLRIGQTNLPHISYSLLADVWPELAAVIAAPNGQVPAVTVQELPGTLAQTERADALPLPQTTPIVPPQPATNGAAPADLRADVRTPVQAPALAQTTAPAPATASATAAAPPATPTTPVATPGAAATARALPAFLTPRALITIAVGLAVLIYALDLTIVATAGPTIVGELHAFNLYGWLFSAYSIPATVTTLLYGRLADIIGRKRLFTVTMSGFLLGSVACGLSTNILMLLAFRALQGIFAGATFPLGVAILADVYPIEQRARGFRIVPTAFAFASVLGPLAGGVITASPLGWRWIFYVNVPVIVLAIAALRFFYHEGATARRLTLRQIDWVGAATFAAGLTSVLIGVSVGGHELPWASWQEIMLIGAGLILLAAFVVRQRRTPFPLLPLTILGHRGLGGALLTISLLIWIVYSLLFFIPNLARGVLGVPTAWSGLILIPLMATWSFTAFFSLRFGQRYGFRTVALVGCIGLAAALVALTLIGPHDSWLILFVPMFFAGLGAGMINPNMMLLAQNSLSDRDQGLAGGLGNCTNALTNALIAPILTAFELTRLGAHFGGQPPDPSQLLSPAGLQTMAQGFGDLYVRDLQLALNGAIHDIFLVGFVPLVLAIGWLVLVVPTNAVARRLRMAPLGR